MATRPTIVGALIAVVAIILLNSLPRDGQNGFSSLASPGASRSGGHTPALPRAAAELPRGVRVIFEPEGYLARVDVLAGRLALPTGRLAIDDYYYGNPQVSLRVRPGRDQLRITLAEGVHDPSSSGGVALATLITGPGQPVRWRRIGIMGTDGGLGGFASAEAADRMAKSPDAGLHDRQLQAISASADGVAQLDVGNDLNLFTFSTGLGDGGYPVYAGSDRSGRTVRVVIDCELLHLAWPT